MTRTRAAGSVVLSSATPRAGWEKAPTAAVTGPLLGRMTKGGLAAPARIHPETGIASGLPPRMRAATASALPARIHPGTGTALGLPPQTRAATASALPARIHPETGIALHPQPQMQGATAPGLPPQMRAATA